MKIRYTLIKVILKKTTSTVFIWTLCLFYLTHFVYCVEMVK